MGLGGGTWLTQNKILPGAYINFVSAARASANLSDRGIATMPVVLDWGPLGEDEVMEVTTRDFQRHSKSLFGYEFTHPKLKGLRDLFRNIRVAYLYRLGTGGEEAYNDYAEAKFVGERGNDIIINIIVRDVDEDGEPTSWDVRTLLGTTLVDVQTVNLIVSEGDNSTVVKKVSELVDNDFVTWKLDGEFKKWEELGGAVLDPDAGAPLTGGLNPTDTDSFDDYLKVIGSYSFNAIGCPSNDPLVKGQFASFTESMRDEEGIKFQCVVHDYAADYEGVINVMNKAADEDSNEYDLVWWTTGVAAGTAVNRSATNRVYDGEYTVNVEDLTQQDFKRAIQAGEFAFYRNGSSEFRVLRDINSLVNLTVEKGEDFQQNQTIRVLDQIANDIAVLLNTRYLGVVPNDQDGRVSLWSDIVQHHNQLQTIRAIEDFSPDDVIVEQGATKRSVLVSDVVTPVNAMEKLYMTVSVA